MTQWVTATTQVIADNAANKMWYNYLMGYASNTEKLVGDGVGEDCLLSDLEGMTEAQVTALKSYGKCQSTIQDVSALTVGFTNSFIADNDPNLWILCPDPGSAIMDGVVNTTLQEQDSGWWPPIDLE